MRQREEKDAAPRCPFCGTDLKRPVEIAISDTEKGPGGVCACGAVYLVDPTGKNVGTLMANALLMAADRLSKGIGDLVPDEDYQDAILNYDWRTHRSSGIGQGYTHGHGRLYIMKVRTRTA